MHGGQFGVLSQRLWPPCSALNTPVKNSLQETNGPRPRSHQLQHRFLTSFEPSHAHTTSQKWLDSDNTLTHFNSNWQIIRNNNLSFCVLQWVQIIPSESPGSATLTYFNAGHRHLNCQLSLQALKSQKWSHLPYSKVTTRSFREVLYCNFVLRKLYS